MVGLSVVNILRIYETKDTKSGKINTVYDQRVRTQAAGSQTVR